MKRKILLTLVLALLLTALPLCVQAEETAPQTAPLPFQVNPLFEGCPAPQQPEAEASSGLTESKQSQTLHAGSYVSFSQAVTQLRNALKSRATAIDIFVEHPNRDYETVANELLTEAMVHTGNPTEGDYLLWQFYGWGGEVYYEYLENGNYGYQFILSLEYYTTAAQENELNTAVKNLLSSLGVSSMTDYQKVKAVYDYMIQNIVYDEAHLNDDAYTLKFTAYAALMNKTAVCQGYATLLYRLMLEMGIDCRVIAGETEGGGHAWNIVKLGDVYYNLDATWDAGYDDYVYFLRNSEGFADHYRYLEFMTTQFHTQYPMSETDYVDGVAGQPEHIYIYGTCGNDAYFSIDRDGVLTISGTGETADFTYYYDESGNAPIPPWTYWMDGFDTVIVEDGITAIGVYAFGEFNNIKKVALPDSVTYIDNNAFSYCQNLSSIDLGNSLESLGSSVFSGCTSLKSIELPDSLYSFGAYAFQYCEGLTEITIPNAMSEIGDYAFHGCTNLKTVNWADGTLTRIGEHTFENCTGLTTIHIPDSVTHIGRSAFADCSNLQDVSFSRNLTLIDSRAFMNCIGLTTLNLPEGLEDIQDAAFSYCHGLTEITIPSSVTYLSGFSNCNNLETVNFNNKSIESYAFDSCPKLKNLNFAEGFEKIGDATFQYCESLTEVVIPSSVTYLGSCAFQSCSNLKKVVLNNNSIDVYVFNGCAALETVEFGPNMEQIGMCAFDYCSGIKELWFSGDAPTIDDLAFRGVTATAYYPSNNTAWTEDKLQNYGGTLTWVSTHVHDLTDVVPVYDAATRTHIYDCLTCDVSVSESCSFIPAITNDASVTEAGVTTRTCSVCGGSYETYFYLRLMGSNRYETSVLAADQLKIELGVDEFENIIVASGTGFADALAGSYLAVQKNAPILLVNKNTVATVAEYIGENLASGGTVYLLGGNAAIPTSMEEELEGLYVERLAGSNRYETNLMILEEAGFAGEEILVCTGNGFADSLSASAVGKPILLVNKSLNAAQLEFIESTSGEFIIIGGESAVSTAVENKLGEYGEVTRLAGANRYETSVLVAEKFFESPTSAVVAYSQNFPDGLCGGPLAAATNSPLLLMATNRGDNVIAYAQESGIACGAVLGGTGLIDDATARDVFSMK